MENNETLVLSLFPNHRGLGFVCIEWPKKLLDAGMAVVHPVSNSQFLDRVIKYIDFFKPSVIIIRNCKGKKSDREKRIENIVDDITTYSEKNHIPIYGYTRQQIRDVFEQFGATTKNEIAKKIIEWFPQLEWRAPTIRKAWMDEDCNMGVFDAFALAVTHKYLTE